MFEVKRQLYIYVFKKHGVLPQNAFMCTVWKVPTISLSRFSVLVFLMEIGFVVFEMRTEFCK